MVYEKTQFLPFPFYRSIDTWSIFESKVKADKIWIGISVKRQHIFPYAWLRFFAVLQIIVSHQIYFWWFDAHHLSDTKTSQKKRLQKTFSIFQLSFQWSLRWCKLENRVRVILLLCATFVVLLCATFQPNFYFYCNMCGITSTHSCISIFAYLLYPILVTCCPALNKVN